MIDSYSMTKYAVQALDKKSAKDIKVLKTSDITVLAEYFVICTANNATHIKTLTDEIEKDLGEKGEIFLRREGLRSGGWVILDYGCLIVHVFLKEARQFYSLERLWGDAPQIDPQELIDAGDNK